MECSQPLLPTEENSESSDSHLSFFLRAEEDSLFARLVSGLCDAEWDNSRKQNTEETGWSIFIEKGQDLLIREKKKEDKRGKRKEKKV